MLMDRWYEAVCLFGHLRWGETAWTCLNAPRPQCLSQLASRTEVGPPPDW